MVLLTKALLAQAGLQPGQGQLARLVELQRSKGTASVGCQSREEMISAGRWALDGHTMLLWVISAESQDVAESEQ